MEDIVGDYKDKTVTLEDFPFFEHGVKMASVHPCKHASVMKVLLDRADAALKIRKQKLRSGRGGEGRVESGMEGLVDEMQHVGLAERERRGFAGGVAAAGGAGGDEWEVLQHEGGGEEEEVAIRVDQYLVVFLKVRTVACSIIPIYPSYLLGANPYPVHGLCDTRHRARLHHGSLGATRRLLSFHNWRWWILALISNPVWAINLFACRVWNMILAPLLPFPTNLSRSVALTTRENHRSQTRTSAISS